MYKLAFYRSHKNNWQELAYSASIFKSKEGYDCHRDTNAKPRYALLIELQYNLQVEDESLVRYLFKQEILACEQQSMGGSSDALILAAYLLASFKDPNDIILFYKAKHANFDTSFVIDNEYMFYALRNKTEAFIKDKCPEIYGDLKGLYSEYYTDSILEQWWSYLSSSYPNREEDEDLYTLYQRSFYFDDYNLAKNYLEQWNRKTPDSANKKSVLKYAYSELEEYLNVIELLKEELVACETHWDRTSCLQDLLDFYTRTEQSENALATVECIDKELQKFDDWKDAGLGRMTLEQIFEYSLLTDNSESGIQAFNLAYKWLDKIRGNISYVGLKTASEAADKYLLIAKSTKLQKLLIAEKRRIDKAFKSI